MMNNIAKLFVSSVITIMILPLIVVFKINYAITNKDKIFSTISQVLSLIPGKTGVYSRNAFYKYTLEKCGNDVNVGFGTIFTHYKVKIGDHVYIGARCTIGMADIGDNTMIGSNVDMLSGKRQHHRDNDGKLQGSEHGIFQTIKVGKDVWIGNSAVILADIGDKCTIGAGSVVTKIVEADNVVVGNPARPINS